MRRHIIIAMVILFALPVFVAADSDYYCIDDQNLGISDIHDVVVGNDTIKKQIETSYMCRYGCADNICKQSPNDQLIQKERAETYFLVNNLLMGLLIVGVVFFFIAGKDFKVRAEMFIKKKQNPIIFNLKNENGKWKPYVKKPEDHIEIKGKGFNLEGCFNEKYIYRDQYNHPNIDLMFDSVNPLPKEEGRAMEKVIPKFYKYVNPEKYLNRCKSFHQLGILAGQNGDLDKKTQIMFFAILATAGIAALNLLIALGVVS